MRKSRRGAIVALLALLGAAPAQSDPAALRADRLLVRKAERTLEVYFRDVRQKSYRVALGSSPVGPKREQGDQRTPEGTYTVVRHLPKTTFHRALLLSYPNDNDAARARAAGVNPGSSIEIHGLRDDFRWVGSAHVLFDWTNGCIALTNREIDELSAAVPDGTPVEIVP
jgi:murein L,D-transpeptidase YafK